MVRNGPASSQPTQPTPTEWIEIDKAYKTPPFSVRRFESHELLKGTKNFKDWDGMITLELRAANLIPFIESRCGMSINISPSRRVMCDAQVVQYLRASVSTSICKRINTILNAFETYAELKKLFAENDFHEYLELHNRMQYLKFRQGYDVDRFIADFDRLIDDFKSIGTQFNEQYKKSLFLNKIENIKEPKSPFFSFYSTITSLPTEIATLDYIKQRFQSAAKSIPPLVKTTQPSKRKLPDQPETTEAKKPKPDAKWNEEKSKSKEVKSKPFHEKYTTEQRDQLKTMSKDEKKQIQCKKCSDFFHKVEDCPNPGRLCFNCYVYGHEKTACKSSKGGKATKK